MVIDNGLLTAKWGEFSDLDEMSAHSLQSGRFSVIIDQAQFECLLNEGQERRLFVLLSGARDPSTHPLPKFDRWSWGDIFPGSVLCVSDPTLYLAPQDLHIGWYIGTANKDWLQSMADLVTKVALRLNVPSDQIICYGSSAGGFGALMLASKLGSATAVAINPQTDVTKYLTRFVKRYLDVAFNGRTPDSLTYEEYGRFSAIDTIAQSENVKCLIVQNVQDRVHYTDHYTPFCLRLGVPLDGGSDGTGRIESLTFNAPGGHGPEPKELAPEIIARAVMLSMAPLNKNNSQLESQQSVGESLQPEDKLVARMLLENKEVTDLPERNRIRAKQLYLITKDIIPSKPVTDGRMKFVAAGRKDLPSYELAFPLDWCVDPFADRNWCAQLHMWRMVDGHLAQHDKTTNSEWLKLPIAVIQDWHRFHCVEKRASPLAWKDMMVGLRAMKLAYVISNLRGTGKITPELSEVFEQMVQAHLEFLLDKRNVTYSNHTFLDVHGAAALAQVVHERKAQEIDAFTDEVLAKLIALQFNEHGVHLENSPGYQPFGIGCLKRLRTTGWFDRFHLDVLINQAEDVLKWMLMPDGRTIAIGDTDGAHQDRSVINPVFQGRRQVFNSSGYAIVRDDGGGDVRKSSLLAVMGASNSRFHKHADDLSFVWFEGEDILCDAGKFSYNLDPRREYVMSTRAHNTVEIAGKSYADYSRTYPERVYGSAIKTVAVHDWGYLIDGAVKHNDSGVQHLRAVAYKPGAWILVLDRLISPTEQDFTQWHHFSPELPDLVKEEGGYYTELTNGRTLRIFSVGNSAVTDILEKGQTKPRLQGWISKGYRELSPNCALGYQQSGSDVVFATLLSLDDTGSKISFQDAKRLILDISRNEKQESYRFVLGESSFSVRRR